MSTAEKAALYNELKASGLTPTQPYRNYTVAQLKAELRRVETPPEQAEGQPPSPEFFGLPEPAPAPATVPSEERSIPRASEPDPDELPGQRLNTLAPDEVIRVDEQGRKWHQEEVRKPSYPKPRGRRVLKYMDTGVRTETVQNGDYVETFEVSGDQAQRPAEVKITLPSYQVGIYTDPRFPFKIHCYDGREGFNRTDVQAYYGGSELVPDTIKRVYVENDLCYDIRSVIRTIQAEHRHLQLTGKIK